MWRSPTRKRARKRVVAALLVGAACAHAHSQADALHLLIPAGPGGGLDGTARALGQVLRSEGRNDRVSYQNMTGGGGGRAMSYFIETAARQHDSLIVNSTPLLIRSLQGLFPHSHHDLTPIAALIDELCVGSLCVALFRRAPPGQSSGQ